jgi:hypothetical protein
MNELANAKILSCNIFFLLKCVIREKNIVFVALVAKILLLKS